MSNEENGKPSVRTIPAGTMVTIEGVPIEILGETKGRSCHWPLIDDLKQKGVDLLRVARDKPTAEGDWIRRNPWFDRNGSDAASMIARGIAEWLHREGYSAENEAMWKELDRQLVIHNVLAGPDVGKIASSAVDRISPRITPEMIENNIVSSEFIKATDRLTICLLTLRNGYVVTGESACAYPENYDQTLGERYSRENAVEKVWPLLGYLLREDLHRAQKAKEKEAA